MRDVQSLLAVRKREVFFAPEAAADLNGLYDYISEHSGTVRAIAYVRRIERYCRGFELASARGTRRDDIRPGLRVVGFERRITIAFHLETDRVIIDRLFYGGRDFIDRFRRAENETAGRWPGGISVRSGAGLSATPPS